MKNTQHTDTQNSVLQLANDILETDTPEKNYSEELRKVNSTAFGRGIAAFISEIYKMGKPLGVARSRDVVVVMSAEEYNQLQHTKEHYEVLVSRLRTLQRAATENIRVKSAREEFERLFDRMQTAQAVEAMKSMIDATEDELKATYKPGRTERN